MLKSIPFLNGKSISELGFGAAEIGNLHRALSDAEADAALDAARAAGITLFDTAPFYGHGLSELRLGRFLRASLRDACGSRDAYVLSTKVGRYMIRPGADGAPGPWAAPLDFAPVFDYSYDGTMRSLEQSRMRLGLPIPDIVFIHDLDRRNHGAAFDDHFRIATGGVVRALHALRRSGDVGAIGVATNEGDAGRMLLREGDFDCALLAGRYTLLDQSALGDFLPYAQARGVKIVSGGVFNTGILATGARPGALYDYAPAPDAVLRRVRAFEAICARHRVPLAAAAIQFARFHPAIVSVLIGASRPASVARGVEALQAPTPPDLWREIRESGLIAPGAPLPGCDA
jgi:D-threo-aldose 1-dehydrogenase